MQKHIYNSILSFTGQIQIHLFTAISFATTLLYFDYSNRFILETIAAISSIRLIFYITRSAKPALDILSIRKKMNRLLEDELSVSITLAAFCLFTNWTILANDLITILSINLAVQIIGLVITNQILSFMNSKNKSLALNQNILIIGTGENGLKAADAILDAPESRAALKGFLDINNKGLWSYRDIPRIGHPDELAGIIANSQIDLIVCALECQEMSSAHKIFKVADEMGTPISFVPTFKSSPKVKIKPAYINSLPMILYRSVEDNLLKLYAKSIIDKVGAIVGIILFSPVMLATAIAIKIEDNGPVFFSQVRSGINGKQFSLLKFRTMCIDAEAKKAELEELNEMSGPVFKITNDPRVTKVGHLLRKTSMDELPQFFNVLLGDMSIVGPRPPLPKEVSEYENWQHRRLSVKPGVTCTWQVNGRNNIDFDDWMKLDLEYIDNWSLWNDTKIIAKTIPAVMKGSGAS